MKKSLKKAITSSLFIVFALSLSTSVYAQTKAIFDVQILEEQASATISDKLDYAKFGLTADDWMEYQVYLYIHPLKAEGWWRQNGVNATDPWTAMAYLGGIGQYKAKNGEIFKIMAVIANVKLPEKVFKITDLKGKKGIHIIPKEWTVTVRR